MNISNEEFKEKIKCFLTETSISPTAFGIKAKNDPLFVKRVFKGQEVKEDGKRKVIDFMENYKQGENS